MENEQEFYSIYANFISAAVQQTSSVFGPSVTEEQLKNFRLFFRDFIDNAMLNGNFNGKNNQGEVCTLFTSGGNYTTGNLSYALIASGISADGCIPEGRCYLATSLEPTDKAISFAKQNKINPKFIEEKINNIYNWLNTDANTKNADPNANELVEIFIKANNIKNASGNMSQQANEQLKAIWENRKNNYIKNGLGDKSLSYEICNACYDGELSKINIDLASMKSLQTMAGVDLWINQNMRNGQEVQFNNQYEITELTNCIKASKKTGLDLSNYINTFIQQTGVVIDEDIVTKTR